jgi:hypothetical protein
MIQPEVAVLRVDVIRGRILRSLMIYQSVNPVTGLLTVYSPSAFRGAASRGIRFFIVVAGRLQGMRTPFGVTRTAVAVDDFISLCRRRAAYSKLIPDRIAGCEYL